MGSFKVPKGFSPSKQHLFECIIDGIDPIFCKSGSFPFPTLESQQIKSVNSFKYIAGAKDISGLDITFYESDARVAFTFITRWLNQVYDENGLLNYMSEYYRSLIVYALNGNLERTFGFKYIGVFPLSVSPFEPDSETSTEINSFTVSFSLNDVQFL